MDQDRIRKLARLLDVIAESDQRRMEEEKRIDALRRECAFELYAICSNFVRSVNSVATRIQLELAPPTYSREAFRDDQPNLFQINISGRIIQLAFEITESLVSTEDFHIPYTLQGSVRWYNQESLEGLGIHEQQLFLCLVDDEPAWMYFDPRTHKKGVFDEDYLADHMEEILR